MGKLIKYILLLTVISISVTFFTISSSNAAYLDSWDNITTFDGYKATGKYWWNKTTEDNEVEPGATTGQKWDLEGFFTNDTNNLGLVGGFDFENGEDWVQSGDIFIDTNNDDSYWEYVIDLNFSDNNYNVYENDGSISYNYTHNGPSGTSGLKYTRSHSAQIWSCIIADNNSVLVNAIICFNFYIILLYYISN